MYEIGDVSARIILTHRCGAKIRPVLHDRDISEVAHLIVLQFDQTCRGLRNDVERRQDRAIGFEGTVIPALTPDKHVIVESFDPRGQRRDDKPLGIVSGDRMVGMPRGGIGVTAADTQLAAESRWLPRGD
jgi:hypothetical protein